MAGSWEVQGSRNLSFVERRWQAQTTQAVRRFARAVPVKAVCDQAPAAETYQSELVQFVDAIGVLLENAIRLGAQLHAPTGI